MLTNESNRLESSSVNDRRIKPLEGGGQNSNQNDLSDLLNNE